MSLIVLIVWLSTAGIMIMLGTVFTIRRFYTDRQDQVQVREVVDHMKVVHCSYCQDVTTSPLGVTCNGQAYDPVCLDCQYRTGIRCLDGSISAEYFYQVEPFAQLERRKHNEYIASKH